MKEHGFVPINLHLRTLKFESYVIFMLFFFWFFQPLKDLKTISCMKTSDLVHSFSLQAIIFRESFREHCFLEKMWWDLQVDISS